LGKKIKGKISGENRASVEGKKVGVTLPEKTGTGLGGGEGEK